MALSIDGTVAGGTPVTLTTTKINDVIIVELTINWSSTVGTIAITDTAGLTWAPRGSTVASNDPTAHWYRFWAFSTGILSSDVITITPTGGTFAYIGTNAYAVNGCSASPWDTNVSLPGNFNSATGGPATVSTDAATTMVLGGYRAESPLSAGTGFTQIVLNTNQLSEYQLQSAPVTNLTVPFGTATFVNSGQGDALVAAGSPAGVVIPPLITWMH